MEGGGSGGTREHVGHAQKEERATFGHTKTEGFEGKWSLKPRSSK